MKKRLKYKHPHCLLIRLIIFCPLIIFVNTITFGLEDATAVIVSGGEFHTLVLTESGSVWAAGNNEYGQLGINHNCNEWTLAQVLKGAQSSSTNYLQGISDIDAGWMHSLACGSGNVWAWGSDGSGQLGNGSGSGDSSTPVKVLDGEKGTQSKFLEGITNVSAGRSGDHSLARDSSGYVWSWGGNSCGKLGNNSTTPQQEPVQVHGVENSGVLSNIIAISAGEHHSITLDNTGYVYTFGNNDKGQLGINSTAEQHVPVQVHGVNNSGVLSNIIAISAGWNHSMALNSTGYVYTWGNNSSSSNSPYGGRLGDYSTTDRLTPVQVHGVNNSGNLSNIIAISAGEGHSMALDGNGNVYCWGDNHYGQLGINTSTTSSTTPVKVVGPEGTGYLSNIVDISAGYWHSIAVASDGTIYTWGKGEEGSLCYGKNADTYIPVRVPIVRDITQGSSFYRNQRAIDDASDNDKIEAEQGTYSETIDFKNTPLELRSTNTNDLYVIEETIIDNLNRPLAYPLELSNGTATVKFVNSEDSDSQLCGFTIMGKYECIHCLDSTPIIRKCIIKDSTSDSYGAIWCEHASPTIRNCVIYSNDTIGIFNQNFSYPIITNCTITDNILEAVYNDHSSSVINNCILWDNKNGGDQIYKDNYSSAFVSYCCIQNGYSGTGNKGDYPNFIDYFHIHNNSPCIDAGTNTPSGGFEYWDLDGDFRMCGTIDIGADEAGSIGGHEAGQWPYDFAFICKDSDGDNVAIFDEGGNLFLRGGLTTAGTPEVFPYDEFVVFGEGNVEAAVIDTSTGNMVIDSTLHTFQLNQTTMNNNARNFIIRDSSESHNVKAYIDFYGHMYLMGQVFNNFLP